jgi:hypothetical protein
MAKTLSAVEKLDNSFVEEAQPKDGQQEEFVVREFDPKFMRKTTLKVSRQYRLCMRLILIRAVGFDHHASLDFDLSCLFVGQVQPGQCEVARDDEGYWQRPER